MSKYIVGEYYEIKREGEVIDVAKIDEHWVNVVRVGNTWFEYKTGNACENKSKHRLYLGKRIANYAANISKEGQGTTVKA